MVSLLYGSLDILGVILGIILLIMLNKYIKKEKDTSFLAFLKVMNIGIFLWLLNNIWHVFRKVITPVGDIMRNIAGEGAEYPEYLFIIFAYLAFVIAAYQTKFITQQFAFKNLAKKPFQKKKKRGSLK
ncbi:MAG: hypothetical protein ABII01_03405 [Candidatus Woesearchaeota archaeon]